MSGSSIITKNCCRGVCSCWRFARWAAVAAAVIRGSLAVGVCGYHYLDGLPWIDSLLNASMILGGMGPVDTLKTNAGKVFASLYALYSGLALIAVVGIHAHAHHPSRSCTSFTSPTRIDRGRPAIGPPSKFTGEISVRSAVRRRDRFVGVAQREVLARS